MNPTQDDVQEFQKQTTKSQFDPLNLRQEQWTLLETNKAEIVCVECTIGKILWIRPFGSGLKPTMKTWARILQWYGNSFTRIFWFPSLSLREIPQNGPLHPGHINGGYTFPCTTNQIVIYRKEDAERVLFHELSHASCLDDQTESLELREARTELWAELLMAALFSKGSLKKAKSLWSQQSQWLVNQNEVLRTAYHVTSPKDYVWRYTVGREVIANELRIPLPSPKKSTSRSLRLAAPLFDRLTV